MGRSYHILGYIYSLNKDFLKAIQMFKQAIEYERIATTQLDLAHSLHSLGDMYISIKEFEKAKKCLHESLEIKKRLNDKEGIANSELLLQCVSILR